MEIKSKNKMKKKIPFIQKKLICPKKKHFSKLMKIMARLKTDVINKRDVEDYFICLFKINMPT